MGRSWSLLWISVAIILNAPVMTRATEEPDPNPEIVIAVDPGHGGKDVGISMPGGILEKDLNLMFAKVLREEAWALSGFQVRLTREGDRSLPWGSRMQFSEDVDVWISIHHNGDPGGRAKGPRVFYPLNPAPQGRQEGSSREASDVGEILKDMVQTKRINESILLAEHIQRALETTRGVQFRPSRPGPLQGIRDITCPAVLVEVGFMSNADDRKAIQDAEKKGHLALAILRGVRAYTLDPRRGQ